jgi:hypothetical protein
MAAFALAGGVHYMGLSQLQAFRPAAVTDVLFGPKWAASSSNRRPVELGGTLEDQVPTDSAEEEELKKKVRKDKGWPKWLPFRRMGEGELEDKMVLQLAQAERELEEFQKQQLEKMELQQQQAKEEEGENAGGTAAA